MPGRMREIAGQLPFAKRTARRAIHFGGSRARADSRDGGLLRFQNCFVQPPSFSRGLSDMHSSRAIRAITGEYNTKITDPEPAPWDARERGPAMHDCRARSGSKYRRKGHAFGPGTTGFVLHSGGDFDLSHARPNFLAGDMKKTGAEFHCPADAQDLGSVLDHAGTLDQWWRGTKLEPGRERSSNPIARGDRHRFAFNP